MIGKKKKLLAVDVLLMAVLIAADQITKFFAVVNLKDLPPWVLWEGVFELQYLENRGAAFGMLQGKKAFYIDFCDCSCCDCVCVSKNTLSKEIYKIAYYTCVYRKRSSRESD